MVAPRVAFESRLYARLFQEFPGAPPHFRGHLGKQQPALISATHHQAVFSGFDRVRSDFLKRGKRGNLNFYFGELFRLHGLEAWIIERSSFRAVGDYFDQWQTRTNLAYAAAQPSALA